MEEVKKSNAIATVIKGFVYLIIYLVVQFIVSFVYDIGIMMNYIKEVGTETVEEMDKMLEYVTAHINTNIILTFSVVITLGIILSIMAIKKKKIKEFFSINTIKKKIIPILILLGISINLVITGLINIVVEIPKLSEVMGEYANESMQLVQDNMIMNVIVIGILVPILEELVYRVLPLNKMVPRISPILAIILTSIVFGLSHVQIIWIIYTMVFGIILAVVFLRYKSSIANIIVHCMFNLTSLILIQLPIEVENQFQGSIIILSIGTVLLLITGTLFKLVSKNKEKDLASE